MYWKLIQGVLFLVLSVYFFISCKKEHSCEGCIDLNQPPIALAGPDQTIFLPVDTVMLDGSMSNDPDGVIIDWQWRKISGPGSLSIIQSTAPGTAVRNLTQGIYQFELKVTDDKTASSFDTLMITVEASPITNQPPVARAGNDTSIQLPADTAILNGSLSFDPDNNISTYLWTKIAGPSFFNISNVNAIQTEVTNLGPGEYNFELKVTDAAGLTDRDTILITVMQVVSPPLCNVAQVNTSPPCFDCKIVFVSDRDGNPEIYSCNYIGDYFTRLTYNAGNDDQPVWSPDDLLIAFISDRSGSNEVYTMNSDGSNVTRKTFTGNCSHPAWSPDGTKITYATFSNGSLDIWIIDTGVPGGSPRLLFSTPGWDNHSNWSPDGTKLALTSDDFGYDIVYDIYTINSCGTNLTSLTGIVTDAIDYLLPSWSPDGTKLVFTMRLTIGPGQFNGQIGVMNADGTNLTSLISDADFTSRPSWSSDGSSILYTSISGGTKNISWVTPDGSSSALVVLNAWNADSQH